MRHLIRITLVLILVIAVSITFGTGANSKRVAVDFLFKDAAGSFCHDPCLLGVYLGQPATDAVDQLSHNSFMKYAIDVQNNEQRHVYSARFALVNVYRNNGPWIDSIDVDFTHAAFSQQSDYPYVYPVKLGDILTVLGQPSFVNYFTNSRGETFCNALFYVFGNNGYLIVNVFNSNSTSCFSLNIGVMALLLGPTSLLINGVAWSGFASKDLYKRSLPLTDPAALVATWRDNRR